METHFEQYMGHWTLNKPQKHPNMVLYGMFSQQYIQYVQTSTTQIWQKFVLIIENVG